MKNEDNIQEMQMLEQTLQNILMQKQAFQMELSENQTALKEVKISGDDVFKIIGQLMIKSDKNKMVDELQNKEKLLDLRIKNLDKQESSLTEKLEKIREEIMKDMKKK
jgi:prefoldin beta subunit